MLLKNTFDCKEKVLDLLRKVLQNLVGQKEVESPSFLVIGNSRKHLITLKCVL